MNQAEISSSLPGSASMFDNILAQFPSDGTVVTELHRRFEAGKASGEKRRWAFAELEDLVSLASSMEAFIQILHAMVCAGYLEQLVHVESTGGGSLGDFNSLVDIPVAIYDRFLNCGVSIYLDQVSLIYIVRG